MAVINIYKNRDTVQQVWEVVKIHMGYIFQDAQLNDKH
jgi:hypothetical protein